MSYLKKEEMTEEQVRLARRLQILRGECNRGYSNQSFFPRGIGALASDVFLEFIWAQSSMRLPKETFDYLSKAPRKSILAEVMLKCEKVLAKLRKERGIQVTSIDVSERVFQQETQSEEEFLKQRTLWWDAITLVIRDYGVEKFYWTYYSNKNFEDRHFFPMLLKIQKRVKNGEEYSGELLTEEIKAAYWDHKLDNDIIVQIKVDFGAYLQKVQGNVPRALTRTERIDLAAKSILEIDMVNRPIIQSQLKQYGLNSFDWPAVFERVKEIMRSKEVNC